MYSYFRHSMSLHGVPTRWTSARSPVELMGLEHGSGAR